MFDTKCDKSVDCSCVLKVEAHSKIQLSWIQQQKYVLTAAAVWLMPSQQYSQVVCFDSCHCGLTQQQLISYFILPLLFVISLPSLVGSGPPSVALSFTIPTTARYWGDIDPSTVLSLLGRPPTRTRIIQYSIYRIVIIYRERPAMSVLCVREMHTHNTFITH